jgi:acetyl-CoA acetyltransferase
MADAAYLYDGVRTVTAGNASPLDDGAGALFLGAEAAGELLGRDRIARIAGRSAHAVAPDLFGIAPVEGANRALAYELRARGGGYGVAAIRIGVGQGLAVVLHA